jgi:hypothetical protein
MKVRKTPMPQRIALIAVVASSVYLNACNWNGWPTGSRGFPFAYKTWSDVAPSLQFHWSAFIGNVTIGVIILLIALRFWPTRAVSVSEKGSSLGSWQPICGPTPSSGLAGATAFGMGPLCRVVGRSSFTAFRSSTRIQSAGKTLSPFLQM